MRRYLCYLWLILSLPWTAAAVPADHWDVQYYDLEVQLHAGNRRVAGTNRITFTASRPLNELRLHLGVSMQIVRVRLPGEQTLFQRDGDTVVVRFGRRLQRDVPYTLEVVYGGAPEVPDGMAGYVWGQTPSGEAVIALENTYLPPGAWWPVKADPADEADSMRVAVIYAEGASVVVPGVLRGKTNRPGGFQRWAYSLPYAAAPAALSLHLGPYVPLRAPLPGPGQRSLVLSVWRGHEAAARPLLDHLQRLVTDLEGFFGPCPGPGQDLYWIETAERQLSGETGLPDAAGLPFSPTLARDLAGRWFGGYLQADPAEHWIETFLRAYAELLLVEQYSGPLAAEAYLEATCDGRNRGAAHFHLLRRWVDNDDRWFTALQQLPGELAGQTLTGETLAQYFQWQLGVDFRPFFELCRQGSSPILTYSLRKKGRKFTLAYRWESEGADFSLPVDIRLDGSPLRLEARSRWQSVIRKGLSSREVTFDAPFCVYEIQEVAHP